MSSIYDFVKPQRDDYRSETVTITDGYEHSQYETLRTIELYHNSKFLSGSRLADKVSAGGELPKDPALAEKVQKEIARRAQSAS